MSYYTRLELTWDDANRAAGSLEEGHVVSAAESFVRGSGWSTDVLNDLRFAATGQGFANPGFNKLYSPGVIALVEHISRQHPDVTFFARGIGEEPWDMWFREFRSGRVVKQFGPFDGVESSEPEPSKSAGWWAR